MLIWCLNVLGINYLVYLPVSTFGKPEKWLYFKLLHKINRSLSRNQKHLSVACYPQSWFWPRCCIAVVCQLQEGEQLGNDLVVTR